MTPRPTTRLIPLLLLALVWVTAVAGCHTAPDRDLAQKLSRIQQRRAKARELNQAAQEASSLDQRRTLLSRAVGLDPMLGPAQNNLGVVLFKRGDYYEAARRLRRAADLLTSAPGPWANLAVLHARIAQWPKALAYAKKARELDGTDPLTLRVLARALHETGEDEAELKKVLETLALRDPTRRWRRWAIATQKALADRKPAWE